MVIILLVGVKNWMICFLAIFIILVFNIPTLLSAPNPNDPILENIYKPEKQNQLRLWTHADYRLFIFVRN